MILSAQRLRLLAKAVGLLHDRRGSVAILFALIMPVLIGVAALAVEAGYWLLTQRNMQGAADQAAYSAVVAVGAGDISGATTEAKAVAASSGFVAGQSGITVTVANPPSKGSYTSDNSAWEVTIKQPQILLFVQLFLATAPTVSARAVARAGTSSGCVLGLDPSATNTVLFDNNANMSNANCAIYSNSSSATALKCTNNCTIKSSTYVVGGHSATNNGFLQGPTNATGTSPIADPYASVDAGSAGPCTTGSAVTSGSISPGHYCGGINLTNNASLNMASGVYYIDTKFVVQNNVTLNANSPGGVTIIINGTYAIAVGNNATLNITAQSTGPFAGLALMGPRNSTSSVTQQFTNNSQNNIQGAIYFPSQTALFDNNSQFSSTLCTQVIAAKVHFSNNGNLNMGTGCIGAGISRIGSNSKIAE